MNRTNIIIAGLLTAIVFLLYQNLDLKRQVRDASGHVQSNQVTSMNGSLGLYNPDAVTGGSSADGYWLYKADERQIYFFRYDPSSNSIVQIKKNITQP